jgi:hypothetical protein
MCRITFREGVLLNPAGYAPQPAGRLSQGPVGAVGRRSSAVAWPRSA